LEESAEAMEDHPEIDESSVVAAGHPKKLRFADCDFRILK
jgi:hypothetical protein